MAARTFVVEQKARSWTWIRWRIFAGNHVKSYSDSVAEWRIHVTLSIRHSRLRSAHDLLLFAEIHRAHLGQGGVLDAAGETCWGVPLGPTWEVPECDVDALTRTGFDQPLRAAIDALRRTVGWGGGGGEDCIRQVASRWEKFDEFWWTTWQKVGWNRCNVLITIIIFLYLLLSLLIRPIIIFIAN